MLISSLVGSDQHADKLSTVLALFKEHGRNQEVLPTSIELDIYRKIEQAVID